MFFYKRLRSYRFVITSDMNFIIWIFNYSFQMLYNRKIHLYRL